MRNRRVCDACRQRKVGCSPSDLQHLYRDEEQVLTFLENTTNFSDYTRFNVTATLLALHDSATGAVATEWRVHFMD